MQHNQQIILHSQSVCIVNTDEYNNLIKENTKLKEQVNILQGQKDILQDLIQFKEKTIDELKKENQELKDRIELIENENKRLSIEMKEIKEEFNNIKINKLYNRFITAIQDINKKDKLETKVYGETKKILKALHSERIDNSHFINEDYDDEDTIKEKRVILLDRINKMPKEVKDKFEEDFPNLIDNIIMYICIDKIEPSEQIIKSVNRWFNR